MSVSLQLSAATKLSLPIVEILGKNYYVYAIKKGDSLFGIAKDYGWNYEELRQLNPKAVSPLKKGMKIYYPVTEEPKTDSTKTDIDNNTAQLLTHKVKLGDTVYGISRMYKIPESRIYELNPGSKKGIREGQTLILSKPGVVVDNENADFYTIKKGDTLYAVARAHDTTVAAILKLNPGISEKNFRADDIIRMPKKGTSVKSTVKTYEQQNVASFSTYTVEKKDTWDSIAEKTGVDKDDLIEINKASGDKPKNKSVLSIPKIETKVIQKKVAEEDPRELTQDGIAEIYDDVHGLNDSLSAKELKVALLLSEPSVRKDLEFTRGFLTGIQNLKSTGISIALTVIDGSKGSSDVLNELSDVNPDILFLTTDKGIPSYLSEYAEVSQTPMVNTFDVKNELYTSNPYVIQLLTPSNYFNDEIASRMLEDYGDNVLIFAGNADQGDQLALSLKELWDKSKIKNLSIEGLSEYPFREDTKYLIYGYPTRKDDINSLLSAVNKIKSASPLTEISVLGRPNWIIYDDSDMIEKFQEANVNIPSRFYYDKNSSEARRFENIYKSLFDRTPAKSFPMYAGVGYDASMYFLPGMVSAGSDVNSLGEYTNGAQSDFALSRPSNWSGLLNPMVYLVKFTPYGSIEKVPVR